MAIKRPGAYVALAANYADDEAIMEAGEYAELLYVRILAYCGRTPKTEGWISDKQIRTRLGLELIPEVGPETAPESRANRLAEVGLLVREGNGYRVKSWLRWNRGWEEILRTRSQDRDRKNAPTSGNTGTRTGNKTGSATGRGTGIQHSETETETETDISSSKAASSRLSEPDRFDEFWDTYGKKVDRKGSERKWNQALKKPGITADLLIAAAREYVTWEREHNDASGKYVMDPFKWLHNERWNDERASREATGDSTGAWQRPVSPPSVPPKFVDDPAGYQRWLADWNAGKPVIDANGNTVTKEVRQ